MTNDLRRMPKIELHAHLEGCVRPSTFLELARAHDIPMPTTEPGRVYEYHDMASFMDVFERLGAAVRNRDDVARITYESLVDASHEAGVVYRELFCNPTVHATLDYSDMLAGLLDGIDAARRETGIRARVIPSIFRAHGPDAALALVKDMLDYPSDLVVGLGMDGDETEGAPELFVEAYRLARSGGLHVTAHAGERFDANEIRTCLDVLHCERIDHGYGMVRDVTLLERVRDSGTHVTYAPLSTAYHYRGPASEHPFQLMHQAGVSMSMGSDDPAMGGSNLAQDYILVADLLGFSAATFAAQNRAALDASWLPEAEKSELQVLLN